MTIPFINKRGEKMMLDGSLTIEDLLRMGVTDIQLTPTGKPPDDSDGKIWWTAAADWNVEEPK